MLSPEGNWPTLRDQLHRPEALHQNFACDGELAAQRGIQRIRQGAQLRAGGLAYFTRSPGG